MFQSVLEVNPESSVLRQEGLGLRAVHSRLLTAFPKWASDDTARQQVGMLYRVDVGPKGPQILVQTRMRPDWTYMPEAYLRCPATLRSLEYDYDGLAEGQSHRFGLRANPTKRDIRTHELIPLRGPEECLTWLMRKGEENGFSLVEHKQRRDEPQLEIRLERELLDVGVTVRPMSFDGKLYIENLPAFRHAMQEGLGRSKTWGCGLIALSSFA